MYGITISINDLKVIFSSVTRYLSAYY